MKTIQQERTKYFNHSLLERRSVCQDNTGPYRVYSIEGKAYPSITSVLSIASDKDGIEKWKKSIGEDAAKKITDSAIRRGVKLHTLFENYLLNLKYFSVGQMPDTMALFHQIRPFIDENVDQVLGVELPLYSHKLRVAGTCDLIFKSQGKVYVLDFKTSTHHKKEDFIKNYHLQASSYCCMVEEMYDIDVEGYIILIATETNSFQKFQGTVSNNYSELLAVIDKFYQKSSGK